MAFNKFPDRRLAVWDVNASNEEKLSKLLFLESLGIKTVKANNYDDVYEVAS